MKHLELFAGIGGFRQALDLLEKDGVMSFSNIGYSEIDKNAVKTYKACYNPDNSEKEIGDIVAFTKNRDNITSLDRFSLLTGGFPCQAFSMMGHQKGFAEDRGQMFFRIIDIIEALGEEKPKYLLLENVKNLYTHDSKRTCRVIRGKLEELGYHVYDDIFNTADFHLPQKRNRLYIFATLDEPQEGLLFNFTAQAISEHFNSKLDSFSGLKSNSVLDFLDADADRKYFLSERIKPTILSDGSKGYKSHSEINQVVARPLTATMHKMHRACQDNYYSQDFIVSKGKVNAAQTSSKEDLLKMDIRRITPEEAFMIQGFPKSHVENARAAGVSDGALYKQAGNAVSVNIIYAILLYLIDNHVVTE